MGNMYKDRKYNWGVFAGCNFNCEYCKPSFQAQLKRWSKVRTDENGKQRGCNFCYNYIPHFHEERLNNKLPNTTGDEFIWVGGTGDISFINPNDMRKVLLKLYEYGEKTFFFQTKNPKWYHGWAFPRDNVILGITLETNRWEDVYKLSDAPIPPQRFVDFLKIDHPRKCITIEPIMRFDLFGLVDMCVRINPERIYIGYDTKNCHLEEPYLNKTLTLIEELRMNLPNCKVKEKLIRSAWDEK